MKIRKYKTNDGINITQVSLSDEDVESRLSKLSKERKELTQEELKTLWNLDGRQRI